MVYQVVLSLGHATNQCSKIKLRRVTELDISILVSGMGRRPTRSGIPSRGNRKTSSNVMLKNLLLRTKNYESRELRMLHLFSLPRIPKDGDSELILKFFIDLLHCRSEKHALHSHHVTVSDLTVLNRNKLIFFNK